MLITVATFLNPVQAHIVRGRLECEEIIAFVSHEHHIWAKWPLSQALGGVKVQVASSNYENAMEVISGINTGKFSELLEESEQFEERPECARCGSGRIMALDWSWKLSIVSSFLFLLPLPYTTKLKRCEECGFIWIRHQDRPYPLSSIGLVLLALYLLAGLVIFGAYHLCKVNQLSKVCM